ncbi:restriction endonuclease subunit S [Helicobacter japonicus]|uniref:restriction endonuclease subunit S n=1 Tax=Helicobacter japonicus TaxID=425400 RepID=UPI0023F48FC2|nr:restriction endonuclease subunit S [Helicobacter japonicus]
MRFKDSGIEWLGEIPEHWEVRKLEFCFYESDERCGDKNYELLSVTQSSGIVKQNDLIEKKDISNDDKTKYKVVPLNAIAYNKMRMWQGALGLNNIQEGIISPAYVVAIPKKHIFPSFAFYLFKTQNMIEEFGRFSYGLCSDMNSLRYEDFKNIQIPLPPLEEQKAIAEFLDKKCDKISQFIESKQKLIALLTEKKQALINAVVCRGLNKNAELKESGVKYLGTIPKHWEVRRLASFGKFSKGGNIGRNDLLDEGILTLIYGDIYTKYEIKTHTLHSKVSQETAKNATPIYKGDILFSGSGETKEDIGKNIVYLGDEKAFAGGDVIIFRQNQNDALFLSYALNTQGVRFCKLIESKGEIIVHIYASNLRDIKIPLPPLQEQKAIASYLDTQITKIDLAIEKTKQQITYIKEYKTSLINQVICGRIQQKD